MVLGQSKHQAILRKCIETLGGEVELGSALASLQQDSASVIAEITKTVNGRLVEEHTKFAYVIGADGGRSKFAVVSVAQLRRLTGL